MISHLGAMVSVVAGALLARRLRGENGTIGATCIGDGGTSTGAFHEGLNLAAVEKLPLIVVVANNQYAYSTPTTRHAGERRRAARADPDRSPPPPQGTRSRSSSPTSSNSSRAAVPWPAITSG